MIDKSTKNESFISMWRYLQNLEVDNSYFMLELKNEKLLAVDNVYDQIRNEIFDEMIENPWYLFRELLRFQSQISKYWSISSFNEERFCLTPIATAMIFLYIHKLNFFVITTRKHAGVHSVLHILTLYSKLCNEIYSFQCKESDELVQKSLENINEIASSNFKIFPFMEKIEQNDILALNNKKGDFARLLYEYDDLEEAISKIITDASDIVRFHMVLYKDYSNYMQDGEYNLLKYVRDDFLNILSDNRAKGSMKFRIAEKILDSDFQFIYMDNKDEVRSLFSGEFNKTSKTIVVVV
jgi:hypothetical protein